jgi:hypothetical protein
MIGMGDPPGVGAVRLFYHLDRERAWWESRLGRGGVMLGRGLVCGVAVGLAASAAAACDLRLQPSEIFGGSCEVLVGSYQGRRVGPFHVSLPDGSMATVGSCEGYVRVRSVVGNDVTVEAFHNVRAARYTLNNDCRGSIKNPVP